MSLARIALRIAAVEALKGRTVVGVNVLDSQIAALSVSANGELRTDQERPFVAVYTDAARAESDLDVRALNQSGMTEVQFEVGISAAMATTDPENGDSAVLEGIPATDRGFEFFLDLAIRQIADALGDPENEWAEIFRGLICRITRVDRARTGSGHIGVRLAGQQLSLSVELMEDPVTGEDLVDGTPFAAFLSLALASTDPVVAAQAAAMQEQIAGSPGGERRRLGLTAAEFDALGLGGLVASGEGDAEDAVSLDIVVDGLSPNVTVDADA